MDKKELFIILENQIDDARVFKSEENLIAKDEYDFIQKLFKGILAKSRNDKNVNGKTADKGIVHNSILISGARGTGKSTFLLNTIERNNNEYFITDIIDPTYFHSKSTIILVFIKKLRQGLIDKKVSEIDLISWEEDVKYFLEGLQLINFFNDSNPDSLETQDSDVLMDEIISGNKSKIDYHSNLCKIVKKFLELANVDLIILPFDDLDTNVDKGWPILEIIRRFFCIEQVVCLIAGDLDLYTHLIKVNVAKNINEKLKKESEFSSRVEYLAEQYLLKLIKVENRIFLKTIDEIEKTKQIIIKREGRNNTELNEFLEVSLNSLGIYGKHEIQVYRREIKRLPLRSLFNILRVFDSDIKVGNTDYNNIALKVLSASFDSLKQLGTTYLDFSRNKRRNLVDMFWHHSVKKDQKIGLSNLLLNLKARDYTHLSLYCGTVNTLLQSYSLVKRGRRQENMLSILSSDESFLSFIPVIIRDFKNNTDEGAFAGGFQVKELKKTNSLYCLAMLSVIETSPRKRAQFISIYPMLDIFFRAVGVANEKDDLLKMELKKIFEVYSLGVVPKFLFYMGEDAEGTNNEKKQTKALVKENTIVNHDANKKISHASSDGIERLKMNTLFKEESPKKKKLESKDDEQVREMVSVEHEEKIICAIIDWIKQNHELKSMMSMTFQDFQIISNRFFSKTGSQNYKGINIAGDAPLGTFVTEMNGKFKYAEVKYFPRIVNHLNYFLAEVRNYIVTTNHTADREKLDKALISFPLWDKNAMSEIKTFLGNDKARANKETKDE